MTNGTRLVRGLDPTNEHERGLHCVVRHPDAGGRCERPATTRIYGILNFCPEHGEEARIGALMEIYRDAGWFFERFRNPHTPDFNEVVERELAAAVERMREEGPGDDDHRRALSRAYPDPPEHVREMVLRLERDEENSGGPHAADILLDSLFTILKLMRLTREDGEDWLVELLEEQRQETAAHAAFALGIATEDHERRYAAPGEDEGADAKPRDPHAEALSEANGSLSRAAELLEAVPPESMTGDEWWIAQDRIGQAGGIVAAEARRRARNGHEPA